MRASHWMSELDATADPTGRSLVSDPRLLAILSINFVAITANFAVLPALPAIGDALAVPDARLGLVMTAFTLPTAVMVPVVGVLADLYGRRRLVLPALAVFAVAGVATPLVDSFPALLALRALQGVAFAGTVPLTVTLIGDFYQGPAGATAQGLRSSSSGLGSLLAPAVAGVLAGLAWFYPFFLYGLAVVVFVLVYRYLPEPTPQDRELAAGVLAQLRQYAASLRASLADRSVATLVVGGFLVFFVRYALLTFVPLFAVRELGASAAAAGVVLSVRGVTRILVAPTAGRVTARLSDRLSLVLALVLMSASIALVPFVPSIAEVPSVAVLGLLVGLYGVGGAITNPVMNNAVSERTTAATRAGVVSGMNALRNAGKAFGPAALGVVLAFGGFESVFLVGAAVGVGYAGLVAVGLSD